MKNILISTGGSGGHVIPATILSEHLKKEFNIFMSSDDRGMKFINKNKFDIKIINVPKISKNIFLLPFQIFALLVLTFKSIFFLKKKKLKLPFQLVDICPCHYVSHQNYLILNYFYLNQIWF